MDEKNKNLQNLLKLVKELSSKDDLEWFKNDLKKHFNNQEKTISPNNSEQILSNTEKIKQYLSLSPELSLDYSYIPHKLLKTRLNLDNLRMENVRINLAEKNELKRFYDYIIYAFFQVENLINYYYHVKYPEIDTLLNHFESIESEYFNFTRTGKEKSVNDITIYIKLSVFNLGYFTDSDRYVGLNLSNLRRVRNEGLHRCNIIMKKGVEENKALYQFLKHSTYNSILSNLEVLNNKIKELLV